MKADKRILMLVNEFPPVGESGVQRPLKFLKYLDRAGWDCHVVTPAKPTKTLLDRSLCKEIPARAHIHKTPSWGFGGSSVDKVASIRHEASTGGLKALVSRLLMALNHLLFPIDKQIGWLPFAFVYALYVIKRYKIRNVYITAFPFSAMLVGILLKICLGNRIFWVADYRDAWQFEPHIDKVLPPMRMKLIRRMDDAVLKHCDKIVFVTESITAQYLDAFPWLKGKAELITNGFDEDDFNGLEPQVFEQQTLVYMGKIYDLRWASLKHLLDVIKAAGGEIPLLHIGSLSHDARAGIELGGYEFYRFGGYKSHREALRIAMGAAVNLLLLNDDQVSEGVYTGKIFELLRLGRPMLVLGPQQGLVKDLIQSSGAGEYVGLKDGAATVPALKRLLEHPENYGTSPDCLNRFARRYLTDQLARLYD